MVWRRLLRTTSVSYTSFTNRRDEDFPPVRGPAMFKEENALPRSELHSSIHKREIAAIGRRDLWVAAIDLNRLR